MSMPPEDSDNDNDTAQQPHPLLFSLGEICSFKLIYNLTMNNCTINLKTF